MSSFNIFRHLDQRQNGIRQPSIIVDVERETEAPEEEPIVIFSKQTRKKKSSSSSIEEIIIESTRASPNDSISVETEVITLSDDEDTPALYTIDRKRDESLAYSESDTLVVSPPMVEANIRQGNWRKKRVIAILDNKPCSSQSTAVINIENDEFMVAADNYAAIKTAGKAKFGQRDRMKKAVRESECTDSSSPNCVVEFSSPPTSPIAVSLPRNRSYRIAEVDLLTINTRLLCKEEARMFEFVKPPPTTGEFSRLRLCSYNVLCQSTANSTGHLYRHLDTRSGALKWENRSKLLAKELKLLDADVIGLQEVESHEVSRFYEPILKELDYSFRYRQKTGGFVDGCLLAFRTSRFTLKRYQDVEYFLGETMDRHQIGQIAVLFDKETGQDLCFANTHLLFNEKRGDIKLGQLAVLFANIDQIIKDENIPLFITGDFNIQPLSPIYQFITRSRLRITNIPRHELSGQLMSGSSSAVEYSILPNYCGVTRSSVYAKNNDLPDGEWKHPFALASAYNHLTSDGEQEVSTFHRGVGNPDFIFYSIKNIVYTSDRRAEVEEVEKVQLIERLTLPSKGFLERTLGRWPNPHVPSDHIPLLVAFAIKKHPSTEAR